MRRQCWLCAASRSLCVLVWEFKKKFQRAMKTRTQFTQANSLLVFSSHTRSWRRDTLGFYFFSLHLWISKLRSELVWGLLDPVDRDAPGWGAALLGGAAAAQKRPIFPLQERSLIAHAFFSPPVRQLY